MRTRCLIAAVQVGTVLLGYVYGRTAGGSHVMDALQLLTVLVLVLLVCGVVERTQSADGRRWGLSVGVLVYALGVVGTEVVSYDTFIFVYRPGPFFVAVACLFPLIAAMGPLVRARAWLTVAGLALFIFEYVALVTFNAHQGMTSSGFLISIRE